MKLADTQKMAVKEWVKQAQVESLVGPAMRQMAEEYSNPLGWLSALLTCLRATAWVHQTHHWQTRGQSYYGDHLLFERLYNDSTKFIDQLAERAIGLGSPALVDPVIQARHLAWCILQCYEGAKAEEGPNGMVAMSLYKEYAVLEAIKLVLQTLTLSDGTENLLQDIADKHEEFVYLLKQRADLPQYSYAR